MRCQQRKLITPEKNGFTFILQKPKPEGPGSNRPSGRLHESSVTDDYVNPDNERYGENTQKIRNDVHAGG